MMRLVILSIPAISAPEGSQVWRLVVLGELSSESMFLSSNVGLTGGIVVVGLSRSGRTS